MSPPGPSDWSFKEKSLARGLITQLILDLGERLNKQRSSGKNALPTGPLQSGSGRISLAFNNNDRVIDFTK